MMILINLLSFMVLTAAVPGSVIYTIPASDTLPEPVTFAVEEAKFEHLGDSAAMSFRLPSTLSGKTNQLFNLKGSVEGNSIQMIGTGARANCLIGVGRTDCNIAFGKVTIDRASAEQFTVDAGLEDSPIDFSAGREAFEHQAVGILTFFHEADLAKDAKEYILRKSRAP